MRSQFINFVGAGSVVCCATVCCAMLAPAKTRIDYGRDVRPILSENCFPCHGQDSKKRMACLRLDSPIRLG